MRKINLLLLAFTIVFSFNSCEEDVEAPGTNYITFAAPTYSAGVDPGGSATVDLTVYSAKITSSSRTFNVVVDMDATTANPASYTVPASVSIPGGSNETTVSVTLTDTNLDCFNDLALNFEAQEGLSRAGSAVITYFQQPTGSCGSQVSGTLDFTFDAYPEETSWAILDILGNEVMSGGPYPGQASTSIPVSLCAGGCYTLEVYDAWGDGISSPGGYTLTIGGNVLASGGGNFGTLDATGFQVN